MIYRKQKKKLAGRYSMTIAEQSKNSSSRPTQKKLSRSWIRKLAPSLLLASLFGTYLDLYFAGKDYYSFPMRPFPEIFSIHIGFTLVGIPVMVAGFLFICTRLTTKKRVAFILLLSIMMSVFEKLAESFGYFVHSDVWKHYNSFFGYFVFLMIIYQFYTWTNSD
ncbi:MAG: CBO0543 family protein [Bacillota bacterium]